MKNCDEMVNRLLERKEQYEVRQKRKRKVLVRTVTAMGCTCFAALLSIGLWQSGLFNTTRPVLLYTGGNEINAGGVFCGDYWVNDENNSSTQSNSACSSASSNGNSQNDPATDDLDDVIGMVVVDGVTYVQFETNPDVYTPDACLGAAGDFQGTYQTLLTDVPAKLYTTKEDPDVLIVRLENGGVVVLAKEK
jgi:hypothetical protein